MKSVRLAVLMVLVCGVVAGEEAPEAGHVPG